MGSLEFLYRTAVGRVLLRPLVSKWFSNLAGHFLDSRLSRGLAASFARKNNIRCEDYYLDDIRSFNDFFCRRIHEDLRPIDDTGRLIAPCDGLLSVYKVDDDLVLPVKQSSYTITELLEDWELARRFEGGYCYVFRLCVDHYHRYIYPVSGTQEAVKRIQGVYHTVRPVALETRPVFIQNTREYTVIHSDRGDLVQMEVGAMLVGRIVNHKMGRCEIEKATEKGMFQYGGSTIILLTEKDRFNPIPELQNAFEHPIKMGQAIGG